MNAGLIVALITFGFIMFLGIPLSFSMILSTLIYLLTNGFSLFIVPHKIFTGIDTFTLMAIPFFMLAGELMVISGAAERILEFSNVLVGRYRGGLAYVNILASMLFGGCSGSALADVAGLGRLEISMMEKGGYTRSFSTALTITSSVQGPIIPPSIIMVLIGAATNTSVGALLLGGAIPGVLVGLAQSLVVFLNRKKFPRSPVELPLRKKVIVLLSALPFLAMPVIILGGIISGVFTPTEASAIAVLYGFILIFVYRKGKVNLSELGGLFKRVGITTATILMLSGGSNLFGWMLANEKLPQTLANFLLSFTGDKYVFLIIMNIFLLLWGMFMDALPAILILAPIFFPIAKQMGVDPIHFGVVMGFNLAIGLITPPYGAAIFTGVVVSGLPMEKLVKEMVPFILASIGILILVTYFPEVVLYIPSLFGLLD